MNRNQLEKILEKLFPTESDDLTSQLGMSKNSFAPVIKVEMIIRWEINNGVPTLFLGRFIVASFEENNEGDFTVRKLFYPNSYSSTVIGTCDTPEKATTMCLKIKDNVIQEMRGFSI